MDTQHSQEESEKNDRGSSDGVAGGQKQSTQSAHEDLRKISAQAKSATVGFSFEKLFQGRVDQKNYFIGAIAVLVIGYISMHIPLLGFLVGVASLVLGLGMTARRLRDINMTPWGALVLIIPLVNLLLVIYLCWKHGDVGANQYGVAPDPHRDVFKALLNT